jgi:hypothetical protein
MPALRRATESTRAPGSNGRLPPGRQVHRSRDHGSEPALRAPRGLLLLGRTQGRAGCARILCAGGGAVRAPRRGQRERRSAACQGPFDFRPGPVEADSGSCVVLHKILHDSVLDMLLVSLLIGHQVGMRKNAQPTEVIIEAIVNTLHDAGNIK